MHWMVERFLFYRSQWHICSYSDPVLSLYWFKAEWDNNDVIAWSLSCWLAYIWHAILALLGCSNTTACLCHSLENDAHFVHKILINIIGSWYLLFYLVFCLLSTLAPSAFGISIVASSFSSSELCLIMIISLLVILPILLAWFLCVLGSVIPWFDL